jgi:hypothetical protein
VYGKELVELYRQLAKKMVTQKHWSWEEIELDP